MKIVESGARRDLGDFSAAVRTLEGRELRTRSRAPWVARLRYAYAEALLAAGDTERAREWFERAAGVDALGQTDAADRLAELEGIVVVDTLAEAADEAAVPLDAGRTADTSTTSPTDSKRRTRGTTDS
jgi:TPR repeat protein